MSRCFPYPPPGYARRGVHGEALIESIKFQREGEKIVTEPRKEKKSEKKERRRENKLKVDKSHVIAEKLKQLEDRKIRFEPQQLEKSDLTEEHGNPSYLSDGSQSSSKRKRETPTNESQGNVIKRIRFTFKNSQHCGASSSKEVTSSTTCLTQETDCAKTSNNVRELCPLPNQDVLRPKEAGRNPNGAGSTSKTLYDSKVQRSALSYQDLIENWVPPLPQYEVYDHEDQEWLFRTKVQGRPATERVGAVQDVSCQGIGSLWPHARYLPEAEIHALPFTVPF